MEWDQIVSKMIPHVVKIETQGGYGTGFLSLYHEEKTLCGVATARHVVIHASEWQQPIRIRHHISGETVFLATSEWAIFENQNTDSAVILFRKPKFPLPEEPISLRPSELIIPVGVEVGWLGFPSVAPNNLCFFSGNISARPNTKAYLIDGVSIHGVSGGPVIHVDKVDGIQIVGIVTEYHPNRQTGEALPGLLMAQDVSHFNDVASTFQSIDEANKKKAEFEESQKNETEFESSEDSTNSDVENAE